LICIKENAEPFGRVPSWRSVTSAPLPVRGYPQSQREVQAHGEGFEEMDVFLVKLSPVPRVDLQDVLEPSPWQQDWKIEENEPALSQRNSENSKSFSEEYH
jgi:hypothetical protein